MNVTCIWLGYLQGLSVPKLTITDNMNHPHDSQALTSNKEILKSLWDLNMFVCKLGPRSKSCPVTQKQKAAPQQLSPITAEETKLVGQVQTKTWGMRETLHFDLSDMDLKAYRISFLFIMTLKLSMPSLRICSFSERTKSIHFFNHALPKGYYQVEDNIDKTWNHRSFIPLHCRVFELFKNKLSK